MERNALFVRPAPVNEFEEIEANTDAIHPNQSVCNCQGAGGEAAISVASARCFDRGQAKARIPSNHAVPKGTSPGIQIA